MFSMFAKQFGMLVVGKVPLLWLKVTGRPAVRKGGDRQRQRARVSGDEWVNILLSFSPYEPDTAHSEPLALFKRLDWLVLSPCKYIFPAQDLPFSRLLTSHFLPTHRRAAI